MWLKTPFDVLFVAIIICCSVGTGDAKNCFQCNSTLNHNCQEMFDHDIDDNPVQSQRCSVWNTGYCIKVTGLWGGVVGTHRFCSTRDLGDQCQDIFYPDHDRMYRACVFTCTSDGCNGSSALTVGVLTMIVSCIGTLFISAAAHL